MIPRSTIEMPVEDLTDVDCKMSAERIGGRPRVWLVDDNEVFRGLMGELLEREGGLDCEREFSSPKEILAALAQETPPDVVLLDIQMGRECGLDAIQPIRSLAAATHVIMLTTCFDSLRRTRARQNGATDFLLKSYSVDDIARRVWKAVDQPVPVVHAAMEVSTSRENQSVTESARGGFSNHDFTGQWLASWKTAASRFLRGAYFVRSLLLTMFF